MKWFHLFVAVLFSMFTTFQILWLSNQQRESAQDLREEARDKTTSPERAQYARILADAYSALSIALLASAGFGIAIVLSMGYTMRISRNSEDRIRAVEEELKQLRALVSGNRP